MFQSWKARSMHISSSQIHEMALLVKLSSNEAIAAIIGPKVVPAYSVNVLHYVEKLMSDTYQVRSLYLPKRLTTRSNTSIFRAEGFLHPQRPSADVLSDPDA
jgi:hypothetical protein